ncbi:hypothetical protein AcW1_004508 [Taiwanofungus camphoratus]|nr:hypothetical protein AcV5_000888 [Antrodia cinnamomea]KAI0959780.1 hypothetical protein AcW1_004508 [Antrodia cinnamomea]
MRMRANHADPEAPRFSRDPTLIVAPETNCVVRRQMANMTLDWMQECRFSETSSAREKLDKLAWKLPETKADYA